jgi:hypothetical protein
MRYPAALHLLLLNIPSEVTFTSLRLMANFRTLLIHFDQVVLLRTASGCTTSWTLSGSLVERLGLSGLDLPVHQRLNGLGLEPIHGHLAEGATTRVCELQRL